MRFATLHVDLYTRNKHEMMRDDSLIMFGSRICLTVGATFFPLV